MCAEPACGDTDVARVQCERVSLLLTDSHAHLLHGFLHLKRSVNHPHTYQTPLTQRVDRARGMISEPCCMKPPIGNHRLFPSVY